MPRKETTKSGRQVAQRIKDTEPTIKAHSSEIDHLVEKCKKQAVALKHEPYVFRLEGITGELRCRKCKRDAGIAEAPPPGGPNVAGTMVREVCS